MLVQGDLAAKFMQPQPLGLQYLVGGGQGLQQVTRHQEEPQDRSGGRLEPHGQDLRQGHLSEGGSGTEW